MRGPEGRGGKNGEHVSRMRRSDCIIYGARALLGLGIFLLLAPRAEAQALRFSNRREVAIPEYATLRIGPFYSTAAFTQSLAYRYTRTEGTGTDFLINNRRGEIREDGSEFPIISTLNFRNYLLITRNSDIDASVRISYRYYPLDSQEDDFLVDLVEEGVYGTLSAEYRLSPYVRGTLYDKFTYRTDYVDTRGFTDRYGGRRFEYLKNRIGTSMDWLMAKNKNLGLDLYREDYVPQTAGFEEQERVTYGEGLVYEHLLIPRLVLGARVSAIQNDYKLEERPDTRVYNYSIFGRFNEGLGVGGEEGVRIRLTDMTMARFSLGYTAGVGVGARAERVGRGGDVPELTERERISSGENDVATFTGSALLRTQLKPRLYHQAEYDRRVQGGYKADFETVDRYEYRLRWDGHASKATLFSRLRVVEPSSVEVRDYDDWTTGATLDYPLVRELITLHFLAQHTRRVNTGTVTNEEALDEEERFNHDTWTYRVGTSFNLTKKIVFRTYALRVHRESESTDLEFTRDIFEARLTYSHQF